jgi:hypothetical protein
VDILYDYTNQTSVQNSLAMIGSPPDEPGFAGFWKGGAPTYSLLTDGSNTYVNAPATGGSVYIRQGNTTLMTIGTGSTSITGNLMPNYTYGSTPTQTLGNGSSYYWSTLYTTGTNNPSDRRLKKEIEDSDLGLDFIRSVRPVTYFYKTDREDKKRRYGVIAQELEEQLGGRHVAMLEHDLSSDQYSVNYTELIAPLIKAVQELYELVTGLADRIARIEKALESQQAQIDALKAGQSGGAPVTPVPAAPVDRAPAALKNEGT